MTPKKAGNIILIILLLIMAWMFYTKVVSRPYQTSDQMRELRREKK
jgi:hypothetical protein